MADVVPSNIADHTLETLVDELIAGRPVVAANGITFNNLPPESRSILSWFKKNRSKWSGQNRVEYAQEILNAISTEPEISPPSVVDLQPQENRKYRLSKVRINRFGGLHEFGEIASTSPVLEVDFTPSDRHAVLFYGRNGSGKSSLLSAISWCLTGWFYRPQGVPSNDKELIEYYCAEQAADTSAVSEIRLKSLPIIPMPSKAVLAQLSRSKVAIDCWVEVDLIDDLDKSYGPFRRTMTIRNGKVSESKSGDLLSLGISPADFEVGTRLPAMLPFIRLDEKSGLGEAVARLIDIQPLSDVARHAESTHEKLKKEFLKPIDESLEGLRSAIKVAAPKLLPGLAEIDADELTLQFADVADAPTAEKLDELKRAIELRRGKSLADANALLGGGVDFSDATIQEQLIQDVNLASHAIAPVEIAKLSGPKWWNEIGSLSDEFLDKASSLIHSIGTEAQTLGALYQDPDRAQRIRLYAKVAAWLKEGDSAPTNDCPVCGQSLGSRNDNVTGESIHLHITECFNGQPQAWESAPQQWAQHQLGKLANGLTTLWNMKSAQGPVEFLATTVSAEIAETRCFGKVLKPLTAKLNARWIKIRPQITAIPTPPSIEFPQVLGAHCSELLGRVNTALANIHYARWIKTNAQVRSEIETLLLGEAETSSASDETIRSMVISLSRIIRESQPLSTLLQQVAELQKKLSEVVALTNQKNRIIRAQTALLPLKQLRDLVEQQVSGLLTKLNQRQKFWLNNIYFAARSERPEIGSPQLSHDGKLGFEATHKGTTTAAHQVANASHLRATLVAFWLAYWEYQLNSRGGLRLMLLDDPQDLFDDENQLIFARGITQMVNCNAQVVLATNKQQFLHDIEWRKIKGRRYEIDWRGGDLPVQLLMYREEVELHFSRYAQTPSDRDAKELASIVRIYAESRLIALFRHERPHSLGDQPTLATAIASVRSLKNSGTQPFTADVVQRLLDHDGCTSGTQLYSLLNDAHHSRSDLITRGRVDSALQKLESFVKLIDAVWDHFTVAKFASIAQLSLGRKPTPLPALPSPIELPARRVQVITAVAAANADTVREEVAATGTVFNWSELGDVAVYQILSTSLGLSVPRYCRVIVSLDSSTVLNHSLVIGLTAEKVLARRLSRVPKQPEIVLLNSETLDPRFRAPAEIVSAQSVQLLPVVGVIWDLHAPRSVPKGEAVLEDQYDLSKLKVEVAQSVRGVSAEPLVLNNQTILLGREVLWSDIASAVGVPVCVEFEDDTQALKVVSDTKMGPKDTVRMLHPLGGLGEPILARGELPGRQPGFSELPQVRRVRPMLVVLYDMVNVK